MRFLQYILIISLFPFKTTATTAATVVVDSETHLPLMNASIFDKSGRMTGMTNEKGEFPDIPISAFPLTVHHMGYYDVSVTDLSVDTVYMNENIIELTGIEVNDKRQKYLHILAYAREYSTLTSFTDTVFMFREKMVDFLLPDSSKAKLKGWHTPRILKSQSYYRFSDIYGRDSVSNRCNNYYSWADWVGILPDVPVPDAVKNEVQTSYKINGKYGPVEIWTKSDDRLSVNIDVLADTSGWVWVPNLSLFFRDETDFDELKIQLNYSGSEKRLNPIDLTGYSFSIDSRGRGRSMFMFNNVDEPFFVKTYAEVYIVDKEYITQKEAKKWADCKMSLEELDIYEPPGVPNLAPAIADLILRVENIDHDKIRLGLQPDERLKSRKVEKVNVGQRILKRIKGVLHIDEMLGKRKMNKDWKTFRKERVKRNKRNQPDKR